MSGWSEAAARNQSPILEILRTLMPPSEKKRVLEIGSGTGQHAIHFGKELPYIEWQTSDLVANHEVIRDTLESVNLPNVHLPVALEAGTLIENAPTCDVVYTANTCHIMSWENAMTMIEAVGQLLPESGVLIIYGPFNVGGQATSESNLRFDHYLSLSNPRQALRNREDIAWTADAASMSLTCCLAMPANNQLLVFEKRRKGF